MLEIKLDDLSLELHKNFVNRLRFKRNTNIKSRFFHALEDQDDKGIHNRFRGEGNTKEEASPQRMGEIKRGTTQDLTLTF